MTSISNASDWRRLRQRWSHDWMHNRYLPMLRSWHNSLRRDIDNPKTPSDKAPEQLFEWEQWKCLVDQLLNEFKSVLSPQALMEHGPLQNCGANDKAWLGRFIHELWMLRYPIDDWLEEGRRELQAASRRYQDLTKQEKGDLIQSTQLAKSIQGFELACGRLADAMEKLPHHVLTT